MQGTQLNHKINQTSTPASSFRFFPLDTAKSLMY